MPGNQLLLRLERSHYRQRLSSQPIEEHFAGAGKTSRMAKGGGWDLVDILLTRYACYLVAQNGDPR